MLTHFFFFQKVARNVFLDDLELFSLCCLTLAGKMRDKNFSIKKEKVTAVFLFFVLHVYKWYKSFSSSFTQQEKHLVLNAVTPSQIDYLEAYIVKKLKWRLHVITPLCFIPNFEPMLDPNCIEHRTAIRDLIMMSIYGN